MNWTIGEARRRFAELIRAASRGPQPIYRRDKLAAVLIDAQRYREFEQWRNEHRGRSVAEAFAEYRAIADSENYELEIPERLNRTLNWPQ
ncbi:MAG: type II toxin-antitoxin system prevent-host-death family antitoxin [Nitrococcus sp.]|nr:type II toxin-antitoxin system prevent-host-death family antitoxin [Nitrococcus sp.]